MYIHDRKLSASPYRRKGQIVTLRPSQPYNYPDPAQFVSGPWQSKVWDLSRPPQPTWIGLGDDPENLDEFLMSFKVKLPICSLHDFRRVNDLPKGICRLILGKTRNEKEVDAFFFPGTNSQRALVISGVHGSELSGIEVVQRLIKRLHEKSMEGLKPHFNVIIVPELFPENAARARDRMFPPKINLNVGRYTNPACDKREFEKANPVCCIDPNRQFPAPSQKFDPKQPVDAASRPIERENVFLLELIAAFTPSRIASVHAMKLRSKKEIDDGLAAPGIFADPHTIIMPKGATPPEKQAAQAEANRGTKSDGDLALKMAKTAKNLGAQVPGNKLGSKTPKIVIGKAPHQCGTSLGGWGPAIIAGVRGSITVITVEIQHYFPSSAIQFITKTKPESKALLKRIEKLKADRIKELEAHCTVLREIFLGKP